VRVPVAWDVPGALQWRELSEPPAPEIRGVSALIDGTWERAFIALPAPTDAEGGLDRVVAVASTIVRGCPGGSAVSL
jgi:hypothetical protein